MFNAWPWKYPEATVRILSKRGVSTLFLETSNYSKKVDLFRPAKIARFIRAAQAHDMKVVAWYVPSFDNLRRDRRRIRAALDFDVEGQTFDSFALDIEATAVSRIARRNRRLVSLSTWLRERVGPDYTLGAIVPDGVGSTYWPYFPYKEVAQRFDVFLPMGYFTYRVNGADAVRRYTAANIRLIRRATGNAAVPIRPIGGIAGDMRAAEAGAFVDAVIEAGALGGSSYDFPITTPGEWRELRRLARPGVTGVATG